MATAGRMLIPLAAIAAGLLLFVFLAQRKLLYFPDRYALGPAEREGSRLGFEPWRDSRGRFLGWRAPHAAGSPLGRILVLHGNAGSALDRGYFRDALQAPGVPPVDLYLLEYPGYGPREGSPSERAIIAAATEAIDLLLSEGSSPLLLAGESLGSAAASLAAVERPAVAGLILVTPLASVAALARRHYPWAPSFLVRDRFDTAAALARFRSPVAFLIAGADEVAFADLGLALHAGYKGPKRLWVQEGRGHNAVVYDRRDPMWREMVEGLLAGGWSAVGDGDAHVRTGQATSSGEAAVTGKGSDGVPLRVTVAVANEERSGRGAVTSLPLKPAGCVLFWVFMPGVLDDE